MPYKSEAQRKFFHTNTAKEAGITSSDVKEFDKASKGKELPEHVKKMAEGGIAEPDDKTFATEIGQGITEGINHDSDAVKSYLSSAFHKIMGVPTEDNVSTSSAPPTNMAEGGKVQPSSLEHQVPNAMMARAMNKGGCAEGGYPHVTFLENET